VSSDLSVTKLMPGVAEVQFSVVLRDLFVFRNVQTVLFSTDTHIQKLARLWSGVWICRGVNFSIALHLMPKLRMSGVTHPNQLQFFTECRRSTYLTHFKSVYSFE